MTTTSEQIEKLLTYSATDWVVSIEDEKKILNLLLTDSNLNQTVTDLNNKGSLKLLVSRVDISKYRSPIIQLLGGQLDSSAYFLVGRHVAPVFDATGIEGFSYFDILKACQSLIIMLKRHGVNLTSHSTLPPNSSLIDPSASAPFTGSGATGNNPTKTKIPLVDQGAMVLGHDSTLSIYRNPIGGLNHYLSTLSPADRIAQVVSLVKQPINTIFPYAYRLKLPSRAEIIRRAAAVNNIEPALVAAVILAEQRDQSKKEDAAEYQGSVSIIQKNSSLGLGQIVISTAARNSLFQDLTTGKTATIWSHNEIASLLISDEYNIFGIARYIRIVADNAKLIAPAALTRTKNAFPAINISAYSGNSSTWPADNIKALGSEYTSRQWDGRVFPFWADFVHRAYLHVKASGAL